MADAITIRVSKQLKKDIDEAAKKEHVSKSEILREAIVKYIAIKKYRRLRNKVLPFAEARGLLTDEDIMKEIS